MSSFDELQSLMATLRDPQKGCPWDRQQNHESLLKHLKEECAEFIDSVTKQGPHHPDTLEELADVLFQIVFHCQLYREAKVSSLEQIFQLCIDKYTRRHPHVFDSNFPNLNSPEEVEQNWDKIKYAAKLRPYTKPKFLMDKLKASLDPLEQSQKIGDLCEKVGFDWSQPDEVWSKVEEELEELQQARLGPDEAHQQEELGDLLFTLAQYARKKGWSISTITHDANQKFIRRFNSLEIKLDEKQQDWSDSSLEELESLWQSLK